MGIVCVCVLVHVNEPGLGPLLCVGCFFPRPRELRRSFGACCVGCESCDTEVSISSSDTSGVNEVESLRPPPRGLVPEVVASFAAGARGAAKDGAVAGPPVSFLSMPRDVPGAEEAGPERAAPLSEVLVATPSAGFASGAARRWAVEGSPAGGTTGESAAEAEAAGGRSAGVEDSDTAAKLHCVAVFTRRLPNPRRAASA